MVAVRLLVCACVVWAGCIYVDPIRRHSKVELSPLGTVPVMRGARVQVTAKMDHPGRFDWLVVACSDLGAKECNVETPLPLSGMGDVITFDAPVRIAGDDSPLTQSLKVELQAWDDRGAFALGDRSVTYSVTNASPIVTLSKPLNATVGVPLEVFARYSDADDDLESASLDWQFSPGVGMVDLEDIRKVADGAAFIAGKRFTPVVAGAWQVRVSVSDAIGPPVTGTLDFVVGPDQSPCIAQWSPIVPGDDSALPITEPTLFQVPVVIDELDSYPRSSNDAQFGTATFAWSLRVADGDRELQVGATGNAVELDPSTFRLGDVVELRVEVFDRNDTPLQCPDGALTCGSSPSCLQRQTWRLEVR